MPDLGFVLLTQDACPACERLKRMLAGPLAGRYDDRVRIVHRQTDPQAFEHLTRKYGVRATPTLVRVSDDVCLPGSAGLGEVRRFLDGSS